MTLFAGLTVILAVLPAAAASAATTGPYSIWPDSATPTNVTARDATALEVGVGFRTTENGYITGIRFYKSPLNTGTHVGNLWNATTKANLGSATFAGESFSGWQEANFPTPIAVTAGTTYIASYHMTQGYYSADPGYFATDGVTNGPLEALANSADAPNGVYHYGDSAFPDQASDATNYWVDVVFNETAADVTPPSVTGQFPLPNTAGTALDSDVTATFDEPVQPASITFQLKDSSGTAVPASVSYDAGRQMATLAPAASLATSTTYTATVGGAKDAAGNALPAPVSWSFTTAKAAPPPPDQGPGGPILVIADPSDPFTRYYSEILRAEGLNEFTVANIGSVTAASLAGYDVAILGATSPTAAQVAALTDWVNAGGNLIAMRPGSSLNSLLGLTASSGTLQDAYLKVDTSKAPGLGITGDSMQFHGTADRHGLSDATAVATLYSTASAATTNPAVSLRSVGANGGQAAAFTYDLARSIVDTRQGNPAWAGEERDGEPPVRADDMFYDGYLDMTKVAIPQADEQQRLLVNLIEDMTADRVPLPRFWYLPKYDGAPLKAAVVMTGDDHAYGGTVERFAAEEAASPSGCSVDDWQCIRSTSYIYPDPNELTGAQIKQYTDVGFEVAVHVSTGCLDYTKDSLASDYANQLALFAGDYPNAPAPVTERGHCTPWSDWASQPVVEFNNGIRLDTNYYYWPPHWVNDTPGLFTGSGFPMRFAASNGSLIDVYQATTQMTDESGQTYPKTVDTLLDNALGQNGYYGAFVANMHTDYGASPEHDAIVASAKAHDVPIISAQQLLTWLDGRNGSSFGGVDWNGNTLNFSISPAAGSRNMLAMVPARVGSNDLQKVTLNGTAVGTTTQTIKGIAYAFFEAKAGTYQAVYGPDTQPPTISDVKATPGTDGHSATITWTTDEPATSAVDYGTTSSLGSTVSDPAKVTAHSMQLTGLTDGTTYSFQVRSSDAAGNEGKSSIGTFQTPDVTPPVISAVKVTAKSDGTATVTWTTNEQSTSAVDYGTAAGTLDQHATGADGTSHSVSLSGLSQGTTYYYQVRSKDAAGNEAVSTVSSFTVPVPAGTLRDTTAANFKAGARSSIYISETGDGELMLKPTRASEFDGTSLPGTWFSTKWTSTGSAKVAGGTLTLDGARAGTDSTFGPGRTVEFTATFRGQPNEMAGFGTNFSTSPWAAFGVRSDGRLYAWSSNGTTVKTTLIPGSWMGKPHVYRIDWMSNKFAFYIDGKRVTRQGITIKAKMRPLASDRKAGGGKLTLDWMRLTPYAASGTFTSRVLDAETTLPWRTVVWTADVPSGTTLVVSVRTGDTAKPDGTWSEWTTLTSGSAVPTDPGKHRYLQYQVVMTQATPNHTPLFKDITFNIGG